MEPFVENLEGFFIGSAESHFFLSFVRVTMTTIDMA
jgi:hypothetical protein